MTDWNPSEPFVVGPEFFGSMQRYRQPTLSAIAVQAFRSHSAETIDNLRLNIKQTVASGARSYLIEVFAAGDEIVADVDTAFSQVRYVPNAFTNIQHTVTDQSGGVVNLETVIDDGDSPNLANYLLFQASGGTENPPSSIDLELSSAGFAPGADRRIAKVAFLLTTTRGFLGIPDGSDTQRTFRTTIVNGGSEYGQIIKTLPPIGVVEDGRAWFDYGELNPVTGLPWTIADVQAFDSGVNRLRVYGANWFDGPAYLANVNMVVVYEAVDRRLAYAVHPYVQGVNGWTADLAVYAADGTAGWSKANATDYVLTVRKASSGDLAPMSPPTALSVACIESVVGYSPPADLDGDDWLTTDINDQGTTLLYAPALRVHIPTVSSLLYPTAGRSIMAFVLIDNTAAVSADGQPYRNVTAEAISASSLSNESEFRTSLTHSYGPIRLVAGHTGIAPTAELVVEVRKRSDSSLIGTCRVQPEQASLWQAASGRATSPGSVVEAEADAALTLAAATQYYVTFSSSTDDDAPWLVAFMGTSDSTLTVASYNGSTDEGAPVAGFGGIVFGDFAFVVDLAVDAPTNFAASAELAALPDTQPDLCALSGIPYMLLSWTVTVLGGDFARYTIQRLAVDGLTWETIAVITDEAVDQFLDYEARIGVQECYRMRVSRIDEAVSSWTATSCDVLDDAGCGYTFTSNEAVELSVGYPDTYSSDPVRSYEFPDASERELRRMYGRDFQVAFRSLSDRGVSFTRRLVIGGFAAPAVGVGPAAADLIRAISRAAVSYVCVRDNHSNRVFGSMIVTDLDVLGLSPTETAHIVNVEVVEVTRTPSQPDATA